MIIINPYFKGKRIPNQEIKALIIGIKLIEPKTKILEIKIS